MLSLGTPTHLPAARGLRPPGLKAAGVAVQRRCMGIGKNAGGIGIRVLARLVSVISTVDP